VSPQLHDFVEDRLLPGTGVEASQFWQGLEEIVVDLGPRNAELLAKRDSLQAEIDDWHRSHPVPYDADEYVRFLESIGYLYEPEVPEVMTTGVDAEVANVAGPQLVCPVDNDRFVLNAANARWGSLLDALYGTNVCEALPIGKLPGRSSGPYDPARGAAVFEAAHGLLDQIFPLDDASWADVNAVSVNGAALRVSVAGGDVGLSRPEQLAGSRREGPSNLSVLLQKNGLHVELLFDTSASPKQHKAGLVDVQVESALSTICDFEDSACTVDAEDKVGAYTNWLGLMERSLSASVRRGERSFERALNGRRSFDAADGSGRLSLKGQALLLARNVGMHMYTDMVTTADGEPVPEQFVDALVTVAAALHDVRGHRANSPEHGSVYVVKPKLHGAEECELVCDLFSRVESTLGLDPDTVKLGLMDEERRTSLNLGRVMQAAGRRVFFVNTGFLDRTADDIHTSMEAGPMLPKTGIKAAAWYSAYEANNVATSLLGGLVGRGQIGKGMWAEPDDMAAMLRTKGAQLDAGATTAWVPSPVAATLHSLHYLKTSVATVQGSMLQSIAEPAEPAAAAERHRSGLLTPPLLGAASLSAAEVQSELDNNAQGLLGYVARWVGQGVGCSKVPDLHDRELMEDRATLRISSQHIANWLRHGVVTDEQVMQTLRRIAVIVDEQNARDMHYRPMAPHFDSPEWNAALDLVFQGCRTPNGYTEAALTRWRRARKELDAAFEVAEKLAAAS